MVPSIEARIRLASMAAGLKDFSRTLTVEKATFSEVNVIINFVRKTPAHHKKQSSKTKNL